jgi:hypothetical protein
MFDSSHHRGANSAGFLLRPFLPGGLLPLLLLAGQAAGAEDYLRQLEEEAKRLATTPITTQATAGPGSLDATARLPSSLAQDTFEQALHDQFMNTYVFYQRLKPEDKAKVFAGYQQDSRIGTIRDLTLKLLSGAP